MAVKIIRRYFCTETESNIDLVKQRIVFQGVANKLGVKNWTDWQSVKTSDIKIHGGGRILDIYQSSLRKLLVHLFPEHPWSALFNSSNPRGFWTLRENQKAFFDELYKKMELKSWEDWYRVSTQDVQNHGGNAILSQFGNSLMKTFSNIYPQYPWVRWRFNMVTSSYWLNPKNQRNFFDTVAKHLNITHWEDWYSIKREDLRIFKPETLFNHFGGSHMKALMSAYPEHPWKIWKFHRVLHNYWKDKSSVTTAFKGIEEELRIKKPEDWYHVTITQFLALGGSSLIRVSKGFMNLLRSQYPDIEWDERRFRGSNAYLHKAQNILFKTIQELFPGLEIHSDFWHPVIKYGSTGESIQLDIFIPSINLAFEFQGIQHYGKSQVMPLTPLKDEDKLVQAAKGGITLIIIPYWWDHTKESLQATIHKYRPEIFPELKDRRITPIPESLPRKEKKIENDQTLLPALPPNQKSSYFLSTGTTRGLVPKCMGCKRQFLDRIEPRVATISTFTPYTKPTYHKLNFCINRKCIDEGIREIESRTYTIVYPNFDGNIWVPTEIACEHPKEMSAWMKEEGLSFLID